MPTVVDYMKLEKFNTDEQQKQKKSKQIYAAKKSFKSGTKFKNK